MGSGERTGPGGGTVGWAAGEREKRDGPAGLAHWAREGKGPVGERKWAAGKEVDWVGLPWKFGLGLG